MNSTHRSFHLPAAVALLAAVVALAGCARKTPDPVPPKTPVVKVTRPVVRMVSDYEDFTGRTEPVRIVELKARVTGYLQNVYFKDGQDITAGKPLFDIDRRTYQAAYDKAAAAVNKAREHFTTAKLNFEREQDLRDKGSGSREAYDKVAGDLAESRADIASAEAELELAATNLQFTRVAAPFDGRLSKRLLDPGNLVRADETPLTTIVALDTLYATFDVDERTVSRFRELIKKGEIKSSREQPRAVRIGTADDEEDFPLSGLITFTDNQIDANTGTLRVRAEVRNPKLDRPPWYMLSPGQFIRVRLPVGNPRPAVLVPERALGTDQGQKFVFVVNKVVNESGTSDDVVEQRNVRLGPQYGTMRAVEDSGLMETDRVIVDGLLRVRPKTKVKAEWAEATRLPDDAWVLDVAPMPREAGK
jgi:RND family efflux transporter MFP subunit